MVAKFIIVIFKSFLLSFPFWWVAKRKYHIILFIIEKQVDIGYNLILGGHYNQLELIIK